jgi:PAS domain S-box-containing protein
VGPRNATRTERELTDRAERLRVALRASGAGTWTWDLATDRLEWDERLHEICGLEPGTFGGTHVALFALIEPEDRVRVDETLRRARERESEYSLECRVITPAGDVRHVRVAGLVHRDDWKASYMVGACTDMTQVRHAERIMAQLNGELETRVRERTAELEQRKSELESRTRELENANARLESFSYSVSHDLRAPLRAVSGFAEILSRRHRAELSAKAAHFLDNIVEAAAQMGRLIDDLLTYSRLGGGALKLRPIALADVMSRCAANVDARVNESGGVLAVTRDLPVIRGDYTLLVQTFTNLLENALTYVRPGGAPVVEVTWKDDDRFIVVSVSDNGIGIAADHFEKIFCVFQRLHTAEAYPGTGVGLAVVKRALELQEGDVWVESAPGVGSTFHVRIPKVSAPACKTADDLAAPRP